MERYQLGGWGSKKPRSALQNQNNERVVAQEIPQVREQNNAAGEEIPEVVPVQDHNLGEEADHGVHQEVEQDVQNPSPPHDWGYRRPRTERIEFESDESSSDEDDPNDPDYHPNEQEELPDNNGGVILGNEDDNADDHEDPDQESDESSDHEDHPSDSDFDPDN
ncbi:hypothetical protein TorRG33x02_337070 [Trema orientale]|uniref:Uncharacterized protein n=1 Tax=Trema orientale TaxID=63057 RepID=A0A2P5AZF1_TREOI|nr:hypothetical protein TorRG33x02_337070 [Trema orientale]